MSNLKYAACTGCAAYVPDTFVLLASLHSRLLQKAATAVDNNNNNNYICWTALCCLPWRLCCFACGAAADNNNNNNNIEDICKKLFCWRRADGKLCAVPTRVSLGRREAQRYWKMHLRPRLGKWLCVHPIRLIEWDGRFSMTISECRNFWRQVPTLRW